MDGWMDDYACVESACEMLAWFEGCLFCFKWEWTDSGDTARARER